MDHRGGYYGPLQNVTEQLPKSVKKKTYLTTINETTNKNISYMKYNFYWHNSQTYFELAVPTQSTWDHHIDIIYKYQKYTIYTEKKKCVLYLYNLYFCLLFY